jgi:hypothetical protein
MVVSDATQQVVNHSAGLIIGETSIDSDMLMRNQESRM